MNKITVCDCVDGMRSMPDASVDLILTDPPYGIGLDYGHTDDWRPAKEVWEQCYRILRMDKFMIMTTSNRHLMHWLESVCGVGFEYLHTAVYWNTCRAGGNCNGQLAYTWEPILFFVKGRAPKLRTRMLSDVFQHSGRKVTEHPAERDLQTWIKLLNLIDAEVVCDPFCGVGTTAIACHRLRRNFIGFEVEQKWASLAVSRLEAAQSQLELFEDGAKTEIQGDLLNNNQQPQPCNAV